MKQVGVRELKARLSEYLALVKAGEEVVVTERGKAVARLAPLSSYHTLQMGWSKGHPRSSTLDARQGRR